MLAASALLACAGCGRRGRPAEAPQPVVLGPENVTEVRQATVRTGPWISGRLEPRRQAAIAAQAGGTVLEATADAGQRVDEGQLLARIGDPSAAEQLAAARQAQRSAASALAIARGELARSESLSRAGGIATRDLERARSAVTAQEAQLAQAKAAVARAEQALSHTEVRASMGGVVSQRRASPGDVVAPGAPLFTIVDPGSLRLEGLVPASDIGRVRIGARVDFDVTGQTRRAFTGVVEEVSPVVDPATGQARVYVTLPAGEQGLLGGLFAEGRVTTEARDGLAAPADAIDGSTSPSVMRVRGGVTERVPVTIGLRDELTDLVELTSGVSAGDVLVLGSARATVASGSRVDLSSSGTAVD